MREAMENLAEAPYPDVRRDGVFISYSHKDKRWLDRVHTMVKPLVRNGVLSLWDDTKILPGSKWQDEIEHALAQACAAILLVSPSFLASDFIANNELHPLLREASSGGLTIFWICLEPCLFEETDLASYQAVHDPRQPLSSLRRVDQDVALVKLSRHIKDHLAKVSQELLSKNSSSLPKKHFVATLEFHFDKPLEQFDETEFRAALKKLIGSEVKNVRITSIRRGSIVVTIEGDSAVLSQIVSILKSQTEEALRFVDETGLKEYLELPAENSRREEDSHQQGALATEIGRYCRAYLAKDFRAFPLWRENWENLRKEKKEIEGNEVEVERALTNDYILYLQENYVVTDGIFKNQNIIFDVVTDEWIEFCRTELGFRVPEPDELQSEAPSVQRLEELIR
jgi:hypothetical protein